MQRSSAAPVFANLAAAAGRWVTLVPVAGFAAFAVLVLANNLADWLTDGWPGASPSSPFLYTVADFGWPIAFVAAGAAIAPAAKRWVAVLLACAAVASAFLIGGSWSLNWLSAVPDLFHKIGLSLTAAGAVVGAAGVFLALNNRRRRPAVERVAL